MNVSKTDTIEEHYFRLQDYNSQNKLQTFTSQTTFRSSFQEKTQFSSWGVEIPRKHVMRLDPVFHRMKPTYPWRSHIFLARYDYSFSGYFDTTAIPFNLSLNLFLSADFISLSKAKSRVIVIFP